MQQRVIISVILGISAIIAIAVYQNSGLFSLPEAVASDVVELKDGDAYTLEASTVRKRINGNAVQMLAYNGSIPGPAITVQQGSEITIHFINNTDVEATLHSHGVRLANAFDGTPGITQDPVPVGGSFSYKIKFPDAGIYWYHPHVREDYAQELGLYGNFVVVPSDPSYWQDAREVPLMLDDILLENGKIAPFGLVANRTLMGRFGNVMLVNGETEYKLAAKQGEIIRFYLTNVANTRTFNVGIPGAKIKLVGSDGGKYERETFVDSVIIGPSERATIEVLFDAPGTYALQHVTPENAYSLGTIAVEAAETDAASVAQFGTLRANQDIIASIDPFRNAFHKAPDKNLTMAVDMPAMGGHMSHGGHDQALPGQKIEWEDDMGMMNQMSTSQMMEWKIIDQDTGKSNMDIDWNFRVGDMVKIKILNDINSMHPMQHPIHFHGQRFLVLSTNGVEHDNLAWKDTALVQSGDTVELLVDMSNAGKWMAHCHIAEHLESGMMFGFTVVQ